MTTTTVALLVMSHVGIFLLGAFVGIALERTAGPSDNADDDLTDWDGGDT